MRFRLAALAALLTLSGVAGVPVSSQSIQDPSGESIRRFLLRLEQIVQQSDVVAYDTLLTGSADRDGAARFVEAELIRGMTRAVIQERDRSPLVGTSPGGGYAVIVDVFQEFGNWARVSTWWLEIRREGEAGSNTEWRIANQGRLSSVEDLYRLSLNPRKQFRVQNLEFRDEDLKLTLAEGSVFVSDTDQGTTALVLIGRGDMTFLPAPATEKSQVKIFSGADAITSRFDAAYIRINPADYDRLIPRGQLREVPVDQNDFKTADRIFHEDFAKSHSLELADLSRDTWSLMPRPRDLVAEIHTRRFNTLTYSRFAQSREDISLFDRNRRKTIAQYSSIVNSQPRIAEVGDDGDSQIDVQHYDIDISAIPVRRWIEGRVRMTFRVRAANPINSLTLRLAEPLVVQSVVSDEFGRLFSMRVKDQDSLVVSLPAAVLKDTELTLTVTYAGRLEPQGLDVENMLAGQVAAPPPEGGDALQQPEPSFLYSNQVSWYPRPAANQYATARLRITVPANLTCVASGMRDEASPVYVTTSDPPVRRRTYTFNAAQPLRYFAFVVSRFDTVREGGVGLSPAAGLDVSVEANPGHANRGRELADRARDISRFYQSILDDIPYPTFTIALTENDLAGGHSPGYFAVLNEPPVPSRSFLPRNDPASFENYPEFFLAHELAHQWWGQAVGWRNYHEQWLSEGFAQYFAALYAQRQRGDDVFRNVLRQMRKWAIDKSDQGPISLGGRLGHIQGDGRIRRALIYNKGALVLHMLRSLVGDDVFFRGLRRFYTQSRFRSTGTEEFRAAMEAEAGRPLARFFDQWIYSSTLPRLTFSYRVDGEDVVLHIEQVGEVFDLPVTVTLQYARGTSTDIIVPVGESVVERRIPLAGPLRAAVISKDDAPMAEIVRN